MAQGIEVSRVACQVPLDQLVHQFLAQALDVHGPAGGEVEDGPLALGGAVKAADTAGHGLALGLDHRRAANRAGRGEGHRGGALGPALLEHAHDLGDDIARAADHDRVPRTDILAPHLVDIMQSGVGNGDAAHLHGCEARHRGHGTRAAHVEFHRLDHRQGFHGRELIGHRPPRGAGDKAQPFLIRQVIDLEDRPIDVVVEARALVAQSRVIGNTGRDALQYLHLGRHGQAPAPQALETGALGGRQ